MRLTCAIRGLVLALALSCLPAGAEPPSSVELTELAPGVYHFFDGFYGSLIVVSEGQVLVTDPVAESRARRLKAAVAGLTQNPVSHVVLTHEHYDHVGGTEVFAGAKIVAQKNCGASFHLEPGGFAPERVDLSYEDRLDLKIGSTTVELHSFGPSDGVGSSVIYLQEQKILVTADLYQAGKLIRGIHLSDTNLVGVRNTLNRIQSWEVEHAIDGHSKSTDPSHLRLATRYYDDLYFAVQTAVKPYTFEGLHLVYLYLDDIREEISLPEYSVYQNYEKEFPGHVTRMILNFIHG